MKKILALTVFLVWLIFGFIFENEYQFQLRGTNLKFKGYFDKHQYIIDQETHKIIVDADIVDMHRQNGYILVQRIVVLTYDCGKKRLMFTRYKDELEIVAINIDTSEVQYFSQQQFEKWIGERNFKNPFIFEGHYNNEERYQKLNRTIGCVQ